MTIAVDLTRLTKIADPASKPVSPQSKGFNLESAEIGKESCMSF